MAVYGSFLAFALLVGLMVWFLAARPASHYMWMEKSKFWKWQIDARSHHTEFIQGRIKKSSIESLLLIRHKAVSEMRGPFNSGFRTLLKVTTKKRSVTEKPPN